MLATMQQFVVSILWFKIAIVSDNLLIFEINVLLRSIASYIADCVAPYNIDVNFDSLNENSGAAANKESSCGKRNSLHNCLSRENLKTAYVICRMMRY